jgi:hypothetical protein
MAAFPELHRIAIQKPLVNSTLAAQRALGFLIFNDWCRPIGEVPLPSHFANIGGGCFPILDFVEADDELVLAS